MGERCHRGRKLIRDMQTETKNVSAVGESFSFWKLLTCTSHGGGVFDSPVEAFVAVTDGGGLVVAGAVWRTLGALLVPGVRTEEARPTSWRDGGDRGGGASYTG